MRYHRNRRYRLARQLTKRFEEHASSAVDTHLKDFEQLARAFYASNTDIEAEQALKAIKGFCERVENRENAAETRENAAVD